MGQDTGKDKKLVDRGPWTDRVEVPAPSMHFRTRAWLIFQRALDPLAPPKPLPMKRRH